MRTRIIATVIAVGVASGAGAMTEDEEKAYKIAAFQMTTAYQCAPIIKDETPYEWAKANASKLVGPSKAAEMILVVEAQGTDGSPLTETICRNLIKNYRD